MPNLVETTKVELTDGRIVRVREYDDGSVRFAIDHSNYSAYAITEAYLQCGNSGNAILKIVPIIKERNSG